MAVDTAELGRMLTPIVEGEGYELVDVEYRREQVGMVLRLYIDRPGGPPGGVSHEDCAKVSRQVSAELDVRDPIAGRYALEVSSPGLNRPLRGSRDFARFAGQKAKVRCREGVGGRKNFTGVIVAVDGGTVRLRTEDGLEHQVAVDDVDKAHLQFEW